MVTRNDEHRDASISHPRQRVESLVRERRDDPGPIEDVTRVHHEIDLARERRLERGGVVREKVLTTPPSVDTWPDGQIEAEVGIGEEEDPDFVEYHLDGTKVLREAGRSPLPAPRSPPPAPRPTGAPTPRADAHTPTR